MPGVLTAIYPNRIRANPAAFNPRDVDVWEWIVDDNAPDEDEFSFESGTAFMSGWLYDHDALWDALAYFVGMSTVNQDSTNKLDRWLPAVHPRWPMMRCKSVSVKGQEFDGTVNPIGQQNIPFLTLPKYARYRFDVQFELLQYDCKADADVTSEWERFLTVDPSDEGETIVVDGGQYRVKAPSVPTLFGIPLTINGPYMKTFAQRSGLIVRAYGIPANFVMNTYNIAEHFLAARGKVNSSTFLGLPAQTVLFQRWGIQKRAQPIATEQVDSLLFGVNVEMHFGYTDPTRAEATETLRGWNVVPVVGGTNKWYGIEVAAGYPGAGDPLYPGYDMNKLLQLWST